MDARAVARQRNTEAGMGAADVGADPIDCIARWVDEAEQLGVHEAAAVVLATVDGTGAPSARFVLLRGIDKRGLTIYTNYESPKAVDLADRGVAAVTGGWPELGRQFRCVGPAAAVSAAESDAYWATRPTGSQIAARVSDQSRPLADRQMLEDAVAAETRRWEGRDVPRPDHWGGFRVRPQRVELWQQRPHRLHDRLAYERQGEEWSITRLWP